MSSFFLLKGWLDWIAFVNNNTHPSGHISKWVSEWVIKFNGLPGDIGHRGPYGLYNPCNHSLYIGIIIFPHIDKHNLQATINFKKKGIKKEQQKSEGTH